MAPILYTGLSVDTSVSRTFDTKGNSNKTSVRRHQPLTTILRPPPVSTHGLKMERKKISGFLGVGTPNGEEDGSENCDLQGDLETPLPTGPLNPTWMEET